MVPATGIHLVTSSVFQLPHYLHTYIYISVSGVEPYQGDMLLDKVDEEQIKQTREDELARKTMNQSDYAKRMLRSGKRNMVRRAEKLWVTKIVPYEIDASRGMYCFNKSVFFLYWVAAILRIILACNPPTVNKKMRSKQFCILGATIWNSLPNDCKTANTFPSFKMKLKTMLA